MKRLIFGLVAVTSLTLVLASGLAVVTVWADTLDPEAAARALGAQGNLQANQAAQAPDQNEMPFYHGADVPERDHYGAGMAIEDQARSALPGSEAGRFVEEGALNRPRFFFSENERMFGVHAAANAAATSMVENYAGCHLLNVDGTPADFSYGSCHASAAAMPMCSIVLHANCPSLGDPSWVSVEPLSISGWPRSTHAQQGNPPVNEWDSWNSRDEFWFQGHRRGCDANNYCGHVNQPCQSRDVLLTFHLPQGTVLHTAEILTVDTDFLFQALVNGHPVYTDATTVNAVCSNWAQLIGGGNHYLNGYDIKPYLNEGMNVITLKVFAAEPSSFHARLRLDELEYPDCSEHDTWSTACTGDTEHPSCQLEEDICVSGPETRIINGVPVTRECWQYERRYACTAFSQLEEAECTAYREQGCEQMASTCVQVGADGQCDRYRHDFRCGGTSNPDVVTLCGEDLYCPDGDCVSDIHDGGDGTGDFARAATWLNTLQNAGDDIEDGTITLFKGQSKRCRKTSFGFSNCCRDSGWGVDIGLDQCDSEALELGMAKQAGMNAYVGSHTSGSWPDERDYDTHCVFNSKLSRIVQQGARAQLGISWGTSQNPNCRALTPEEVEAIDFELLDLSDFYEDVEAAAADAMATAATAAEIEQRIQDRLQQMHSSGTATNPDLGGLP